MTNGRERQGYRTFLTSPHFWAVVVLFAIGIVLHYPQQILHIDSPSLFSSLGLTRHAVERTFLLLPLGYAGFIFGRAAGLVSLGIITVIMVPRVILISNYPADAGFETGIVIITGGLITLWFDIYRREHRRRQQALAESESARAQLQTEFVLTANREIRYREIFESANDAIWIHDMEGNIIAANRASEKLTGYSHEELLKKNVQGFLTKESLELAHRVRQALFDGKAVEQPYEQRMFKRDGSEAILTISCNLITEDGSPKGFQNIARDVTIEKEMQDKLQTAYHELSETNERLKESQEQLIQAEKLTSLGQLAASIAHEVNNPLSGILIYTQLLIKKINAKNIADEKVIEYLSKMESELNRSTKLIKNLLDFSRQSSPTLREINLNEVINRAFDLASHTAALQHIKIINDLEPSPPIIMADFDQLQQVLTNLILNAIQAMPEGGTLTLRTAAESDYIKIQVEDTGCGISQENMRKIFTPFFTTKKEVKGVGLGLAVSYGIIQRHKGRIEIQSEEGKGTIFTVFLPIHAEMRGKEEAGGIN